LSSRKPLRILIVEDEILIGLELESLLQDFGHEVVGIAASSDDALTLGRDLNPDLAFVDIHLADGPTGVDVARHLSAQHQVTVIFMTANSKRIPEDFAGARGVIAKPYTERGVREALAYVTAEQDRKEAKTVTFTPFGKAVREDNSPLT
jgi:two-component system, response regulator PdtaR